MSSQSPVESPRTETPFGLEPNVAAGLAYLLGIIGGALMLVGGGSNKFVKWAACQSITLWAAWIALWIVLSIVGAVLHFLALLLLPIWMIACVLWFVAWLYTWITAFQGKEVRLPFVADLTTRFFGSQL